MPKSQSSPQIFLRTVCLIRIKKKVSSSHIGLRKCSEKAPILRHIQFFNLFWLSFMFCQCKLTQNIFNGTENVWLERSALSLLTEERALSQSDGHSGTTGTNQSAQKRELQTLCSGALLGHIDSWLDMPWHCQKTFQIEDLPKPNGHIVTF